jgi:hypothetical protein
VGVYIISQTIMLLFCTRSKILIGIGMGNSNSKKILNMCTIFHERSQQRLRNCNQCLEFLTQKLQARIRTLVRNFLKNSYKLRNSDRGHHFYPLIEKAQFVKL